MTPIEERVELRHYYIHRVPELGTRGYINIRAVLSILQKTSQEQINKMDNTKPKKYNIFTVNVGRYVTDDGFLYLNVSVHFSNSPITLSNINGISLNTRINSEVERTEFTEEEIEGISQFLDVELMSMAVEVR